jgi:hypothetical protein
MYNTCPSEYLISANLSYLYIYSSTQEFSVSTLRHNVIIDQEIYTYIILRHENNAYYKWGVCITLQGALETNLSHIQKVYF